MLVNSSQGQIAGGRPGVQLKLGLSKTIIINSGRLVVS